MNEQITFRPCGECTGCCIGQLAADIYGRKMWPGKPCDFLVKGICTIYQDRPQSPCRNFQCGWSQHLLPEDMRPDKCGIMVSVETNSDGSQFLRLVEVMPDPPQETYKRIYEAAKILGAKTVISRYTTVSE